MLSMLARSKWLVEAITKGYQCDCIITLADHVLQSKKTRSMAILVSSGHFYNEKCYRGSYQVFYSLNMHILLVAVNTQQKPCR